MQMYAGSATLPWAKYQIFLEAFFICNNINTNPLFLNIQISARSSLKKFENKKKPKAEYFPL